MLFVLESDSHTDTPALCFLLFVWLLSFLPWTFNPSLSLYCNCVSCKWHVFGFYLVWQNLVLTGQFGLIISITNIDIFAFISVTLSAFHLSCFLCLVILSFFAFFELSFIFLFSIFLLTSIFPFSSFITLFRNMLHIY